MPKERRDRSVSFDRSRASPFPSSSSRSRSALPKNPLESDENAREWEDARCPVCMEHPHNAILLLCASHEKGCRPFMCDTSYRHSNCFDQFRKSFGEASTTQVGEEEPVLAAHSIMSVSPLPVGRSVGNPTPVQAESCEDTEKPKLVCPLCRQQINGWVVVESARRFMNSKLRSCACETCDFSGTYRDLRKHAREQHPLVRPTEADPERERSWRRLEQQRDFGDLLSTLQSSFGDDTSDESALTLDDGRFLTVVFLVRILRSGNSSRSSSWSGGPSTQARFTFRRRPSRRLWGESLDLESGSREDTNESPDNDSWGQRDRVHRRPSPDN
ncbi:OLC1v1037149C1 [Oldenlandia corymbosa var. corymbosa]|uniref:OLC1v1037149C1 n=1 Tax=Oldenlandia corymbosa var. corymbosa TaxID=529605 RepID=A0AAV1CWW5_OLDCO|nr:OLC1v1037149C1 [Oldenlandia corymbosa var. corymbosa]